MHGIESALTLVMLSLILMEVSHRAVFRMCWAGGALGWLVILVIRILAERSA